MTELTETLLKAETPSAPLENDPVSEAISDAALRQFELFGIARSTMEDISRRAGIARVTAYRRFPGKQALVDAVMLRELRRFLDDLDEVLAPHADIGDRLVEGFAFVIDAMRRHRLLQRLVESEPETILPSLTVRGSAFVSAARSALVTRMSADLAGAGARTPPELDVVADVVIRLILSYALTPSDIVDLGDQAEVRAFASRVVLPLVAGTVGGLPGTD